MYVVCDHNETVGDDGVMCIGPPSTGPRTKYVAAVVPGRRKNNGRPREDVGERGQNPVNINMNRVFTMATIGLGKRDTPFSSRFFFERLSHGRTRARVPITTSTKKNIYICIKKTIYENASSSRLYIYRYKKKKIKCGWNQLL